MCGHGKMELTKLEADCMECDRRVEDIKEWEELLHTKFTDTDDYNEKVTLYEAKVKEAEEANTDGEAKATAISKIRVKSFGGRLKMLRKKLKLTQEQLSEYIGITQRSIINYEKGNRQLSIEVKDWIQSSESTLKHMGKDKGNVLIMEKLSELNEKTE